MDQSFQRTKTQCILKLDYLAVRSSIRAKMRPDERKVFERCNAQHDELDEVENQARVFLMFRRLTGKDWL